MELIATSFTVKWLACLIKITEIPGSSPCCSQEIFVWIQVELLNGEEHTTKWGQLDSYSLGYVLDGPGSIPSAGGGGDFSSLLHVQTGSVVHSTSYKISTGEFPRGYRRPSVWLATLPHPSAVAVNMWTLASTSPVGLHGL